MNYNSEYLLVLFYFLFASGLVSILVFLPIALAKKNNIFRSKYSSYECGFSSHTKAKRNYPNIDYCNLAILFVIFDIEIVFLIPWAFYIRDSSLTIFFCIIFFIINVIIGFLYEYKSGLLDI